MKGRGVDGSVARCNSTRRKLPYQGDDMVGFDSTRLLCWGPPSLTSTQVSELGILHLSVQTTEVLHSDKLCCLTRP